MKSLLLAKLTDSEIRRFITGLDKLLYERYERGYPIYCPLCHIAEDIYERINEEEVEEASPVCAYCTWYIFNDYMEEDEDELMGNYCYFVMKDKEIHASSFNNNSEATHYRKKTIPEEIKELKKELERRKK